MKRLLIDFVVAMLMGVTEGNAQMPDNTPNQPKYALEMKESQRISAVLNYKMSCPDLLASEWTVFASVAPELPGQLKTKTILSPAGLAVKEKSPLARNLLMARVPIKNKDLRNTVSIQVTYRATLRARTLKVLQAGDQSEMVAALRPTDRKLYLADYGDIDFKQHAFKNWLQREKLVRRPGQDDLGFAREAFLKIRSRMKYEYKWDMDRHASAVCNGGKSDCGGLSILFVSVMRANGIPARTLYGRWAESAKPDAKVGEKAYFQCHVKAEFFANGIGWVPIDMASAILHDKSPGGLAYFGVDAGDFITFHIDTNLSLDTVRFGLQSVHQLQIPAVWAAGKGSANPSITTEDWKVEPLK